MLRDTHMMGPGSLWEVWKSLKDYLSRPLLLWIKYLWFRSTGTEEMAVINKRPVKLKSLLCWDNGCWSAGAESLAAVKNRPASLR